MANTQGLRLTRDQREPRLERGSIEVIPKKKNVLLSENDNVGQFACFGKYLRFPSSVDDKLSSMLDTWLLISSCAFIIKLS